MSREPLRWWGFSLAIRELSFPYHTCDYLTGMSITPLARGATAEFVGTPFLVAALTGSGITAERLAGGNFALSPSYQHSVRGTWCLVNEKVLYKVNKLDLSKMDHSLGELAARARERLFTAMAINWIRMTLQLCGQSFEGATCMSGYGHRLAQYGRTELIANSGVPCFLPEKVARRAVNALLSFGGLNGQS